MNISSEIISEQLAIIFEAWGMPASYIKTTSTVMVDTDLHGIDSHGIGMLPAYNNWRKLGRMILDAPITTVTDMPSIALLDGGCGLGHPVAVKSMNIAINKARKTGIGLVTARRSNHFGAAGYYARMA